MHVVGVPVGDDGVRVDAVATLDADALVLTPSHQWPTSGVLSPDARAAVLTWAQRTGALVTEQAIATGITRLARAISSVRESATGTATV
jgi:DNA-binding transcriptional MocR family regulator